jgi:hypothetical protein
VASASADSLYSIFDEIIRPTVPGSRGAISAILDATGPTANHDSLGEELPFSVDSPDDHQIH